MGREASWKFWLGILLYNIFLKISDNWSSEDHSQNKIDLHNCFHICYFWKGWLIENDFQLVHFKSDTFVFSCCELFNWQRYLWLKINHNLFSRIFLSRASFQTSCEYCPACIWAVCITVTVAFSVLCWVAEKHLQTKFWRHCFQVSIETPISMFCKPRKIYFF